LMRSRMTRCCYRWTAMLDTPNMAGPAV